MQPTHWVTEGAGTPGPGMYCSEKQMKSYVHDLRDRPIRAAGPASPARPALPTSSSASAASPTTSPARAPRLARPTGSRPPPAHFKTWANRENARVQDIPSFDALHPRKEVGGKGEGQTQAAEAPRLHRRGASNATLDQAVETAGKALVQPPTVSAQPTEAGEVGAAMEKLGLDEERLYEAARDEAAEIVWKHRNPNAPENNPNAPYVYPGPGRQTLQRPKLQRTRSRSVGPKEDAEQDLQRANSKMRKRHSIGSSAGSRSSSLQDAASPTTPDEAAMPSPLFSTSPSKNDLDLKIAKASSDLPQQRKTSGSHRKPSGTLFQNPNDHIYEEPDEDAPPAPAPTPLAAEPPQPAPLPLGMRRNPFTRFQSVKSNSNGMLRSNTEPLVSMKRFDKYEIHRNEPTQSRNAGYTLNAGKSKLSEVSKADAENEPEVKMKDGKEIRSDELRAATGFSLRNRSPKLPTPTMVSDAPGRPIVSFQQNYGVVELKEEKSILPADPKPESPVEKPVIAEKPAAPPILEKAATDSVVPTRKSVFERPTSRNAASPSPFERPASRSASPFDRPVSRTGTVSTSPLKEFGPSSSSSPSSSGRPATPKGPFANRSPLGRFNSAASTPSTTPATTPVVTAPPPVPDNPYALPSKSATPPVPADPYALPSKSSSPPVPPDPYALPPPSARPQPPVPSIAMSEARPASRNRFGRPQSVSNIPTISVSETPSSRHGRAGSIPSIGVTPPIPTISVSETPAPSTAPPPRGRFNRMSTTQAVPSVSVNAPPAVTRGHSFNAPIINLPPDVPTIAVNEPSAPRPVPTINAPPVPSINVSDSTPSTRPLPDPRNYSKRPQPQSNNSAPPTARPLPTTARTHWTPTTVRTGAQCTACALPISGRIVSAGGCRFHPTCFACYQCGEKLECVAFYPEPSLKHSARVDRIRARLSGTALPPLPGWETPEKQQQLEDQDGTDESPRFYCHLDFHECFSPRCKSCKTPIEGEVIVACGAEWHAGHFFCAQCGDPFDSATPFVEKEGYAWCVGCHTHRYSAKCRGCRKPVTDTVVKALGSEWHQGCFVCVECKGPFDDGRYFLRGESEDPVCVKCEERRLKA